MAKEARVALYPKRYCTLIHQVLYFIAGAACGHWAFDGSGPTWPRIVVPAAISLILWRMAKRHGRCGILIGEHGITICQSNREIIWEDISAVKVETGICGMLPSVRLELRTQGTGNPKRIRMGTSLLPLDAENLLQLIETVRNTPPQARGEAIRQYLDIFDLITV